MRSIPIGKINAASIEKPEVFNLVRALVLAIVSTEFCGNCDKPLFVNALVESEGFSVKRLELFQVDSELVEPNQLLLGFAHCQQLQTEDLAIPEGSLT